MSDWRARDPLTLLVLAVLCVAGVYLLLVYAIPLPGRLNEVWRFDHAPICAKKVPPPCIDIANARVLRTDPTGYVSLIYPDFTTAGPLYIGTTGAALLQVDDRVQAKRWGAEVLQVDQAPAHYPVPGNPSDAAAGAAVGTLFGMALLLAGGGGLLLIRRHAQHRDEIIDLSHRVAGYRPSPTLLSLAGRLGWWGVPAGYLVIYGLLFDRRWLVGAFAALAAGFLVTAYICMQQVLLSSDGFQLSQPGRPARNIGWEDVLGVVDLDLPRSGGPLARFLHFLRRGLAPPEIRDRAVLLRSGDQLVLRQFTGFTAANDSLLGTIAANSRGVPITPPVTSWNTPDPAGSGPTYVAAVEAAARADAAARKAAENPDDGAPADPGAAAPTDDGERKKPDDGLEFQSFSPRDGR